MEYKRDKRWATLLVWSPFLLALALLSWSAACGDRSPSEPSDMASDAEGDRALGATSSLTFNTVPPPDLPPGTLNHGILLAYDRECPQCTLITPRGTALVWFNTELYRETPEGSVPITVDELNEALQPGQPLKMRVDSLEATEPVAQILFVERRFSTTGTVDRSSDDVKATGEFVLIVTDERAGRVDIPYVIADEGATVGDFDAATRVYLTGVVVDGKLVVQLVRLDV